MQVRLAPGAGRSGGSPRSIHRSHISGRVPVTLGFQTLIHPSLK